MHNRGFVWIAIIGIAFLAACSGGQVELPDPGDEDDDDPSENPTPANPTFGMLVTNTSQQENSDSVTFSIPWGAIDANPASAGPYDVTTYMALTDNKTTLLSSDEVIDDTSFVRSVGNSGITEVYDFTVSEKEYEPYCGEQVTLMAMINPTDSELPSGNSLGSVDTISEVDLDLPDQYASSYEQVDIVCGAQEVTTDINAPADVEDNAQFTVDASGSEGPIDIYDFEITGEDGSISDENGNTATIQAPNLNDGEAGAVVNVKLDVSNSDNTDSATASVIVTNEDFELPTPGPGPKPQPSPSPGLE